MPVATSHRDNQTVSRPWQKFSVDQISQNENYNVIIRKNLQIRTGGYIKYNGLTVIFSINQSWEPEENSDLFEIHKEQFLS